MALLPFEIELRTARHALVRSDRRAEAAELKVERMRGALEELRHQAGVDARAIRQLENEAAWADERVSNLRRQLRGDIRREQT